MQFIKPNTFKKTKSNSDKFQTQRLTAAVGVLLILKDKTWIQKSCLVILKFILSDSNNLNLYQDLVLNKVLTYMDTIYLDVKAMLLRLV